MTAFILLAFLLLGITAVLLLVPLMRPPVLSGAENSQRDTTLAILRGQLAELEQERAAGTLSADEFETGAEDLKRRILEEAQAQPAAVPQNPPLPMIVPLVALFFIGTSSVLGYLALGKPAALSLETRAADAPLSETEIDAMVAGLAERLKEDPSNEKGWIMLGRSYKALNRPAEAAEAYAHAEALIAQDAALLVDYAEILATVQGNLNGKPIALIEKALQLNPDHGQALFMAGVAAYESGDKYRATDYWEKLLPLAQQTDPDTYNLLKTKIAEIRAEAAAEDAEKNRKSPPKTPRKK